MNNHPMEDHRFRVGQLVYFSQRGLARPQAHGDFRIERHLPAQGTAMPYRIKSVADGHERVADETELSDQATIETLAQMLYEADNPTGVPWSKRDRTIRQAWLVAARRRAAGNLAPP